MPVEMKKYKDFKTKKQKISSISGLTYKFYDLTSIISQIQRFCLQKVFFGGLNN